MTYDIIFLNSRIFTSDYNDIEYSAMAIKNNKIVWLGDTKKAKELIDDAVEVRNLGGARILPGFVDSHMHAIMLANCCKQIAALPPEVYSIKDLIEKIKAFKRKIKPDEWIQGWGFDEGKFTERRAPNRWDLDKGSLDTPVYILRSCVHIAAVNSKALEIAGITKDTKDPEGGIIGRDENGEPNGILYETARYLVSDCIKKNTADDIANNLVDLGKILVSQGVTTCTDMGEFMEVPLKTAFEKAVEKGYKINTACYHMWDYIKNDPSLDVTHEDMNPEAQIRVMGVKLIGDGSVSGRTAWCDVAFLNSEEYGMPVCSEEDIWKAITFAKSRNCQVSMHAMGAKAIARAVNIMSEQDPWLNDMPTFRIEHIAMPRIKDIRKAAERGIAFVTQPIFLYSEIESYVTNMGRERTKENYPIAEFKAENVTFALSTDAPATAWAFPSDPLPCIKSAVTRIAWDGTDCGQRHKLDIREAIIRYTREGAKILGYPDRGVLKIGNKADFIILDKDIFQMEANEIEQIKITETYINGELVYSRRKV